MSPSEFKKAMQELQEVYENDCEARHVFMDGLLCEMLLELGYGDGVNIFLKSNKLYA